MADIESSKTFLDALLVTTALDKIDGLLAEAKQQKQKIADLKAGKEGTVIQTKKDWLAPTDDGRYTVKIGRGAYPYYGKEKARFPADTLDHAEQIIDHIVNLAQNDDAFKEAVRAHVPKSRTTTKKVEEPAAETPKKRGRKKATA